MKCLAIPSENNNVYSNRKNKNVKLWSLKLKKLARTMSHILLATSVRTLPVQRTPRHTQKYTTSHTTNRHTANSHITAPGSSTPPDICNTFRLQRQNGIGLFVVSGFFSLIILEKCIWSSSPFTNNILTIRNISSMLIHTPLIKKTQHCFWN